MKKVGSRLVLLSLIAGSLLFAVPGSSYADAPFSRTLSVGSTGSDVSQLQELLSIGNFFAASATGYFGLVTQSAVKAWQSANNLPSIGIFGPLSRAFANLNSPASTTASALLAVPATAPATTSPVELFIGSIGSADISSVVYLVDGNVQGAVTDAPYFLQTNIVPGSHSIAVKVTYKNGFVITPAPHTLMIEKGKRQEISVNVIQPTNFSGGAQAPTPTPPPTPAPSPITPTLGTIPNRTFDLENLVATPPSNDVSAFSLPYPTSDSPGAFTYTEPAYDNYYYEGVGGVRYSYLYMGQAYPGVLYSIFGNDFELNDEPGTATILVTQAASGNYLSATTTMTITVIGYCEDSGDVVDGNGDSSVCNYHGKCMDDGGGFCKCDTCFIGDTCATPDPACA